MKTRRQEKIIDLIKNNEIETQEELLERLRKCGFNGTQATISRDMRQLNIMKTVSRSGRYRYVQKLVTDPTLEEKFATILRETVKEIRLAMNIVVIRAYTGMASAAAVAIDSMEMPEVVGSIAGDDTLILITESVENATVLYNTLTNDMAQVQ